MMMIYTLEHQISRTPNTGWARIYLEFEASPKEGIRPEPRYHVLVVLELIPSFYQVTNCPFCLV